MTNLFKKIATSIIGMAMAIGVGIGLSTNSVREAKADTLTGSWTLTSSSSDFTSSNCETYFSQPYGMKKANAYIQTLGVSDFGTSGTTQIKIGVKCLQNGGTTSKLTVYLLNSSGTTLGSGYQITPTNASSASNTAFAYATFTTNLSGANGFKVQCTTFGKNVLVNGANYEVTYSSGTHYISAMSVASSTDPLSVEEGTAIDTSLFSLKGTKDGAANTDLTSSDYVFLGSGVLSGNSFTPTSTTEYTLGDDHLCWESKLDTSSSDSTKVRAYFPVTVTAVADKKFMLIKDVSLLAAGSKILLGSTNTAGTTVFMSTEQKTNNRGITSQTTVVASGDSLSSITFKTSDIEILTVGGKSGEWTLSPKAGGYLYAASSNNNYLKTQETNDGNGKWNISIDSSTGESTIVAQGTNTRNELRYNSSSSLVACYANDSTTGTEMYIYQYQEPVAEDKILSSLSVSGTLTKTDYVEEQTFDPTGLTIEAVFTDSEKYPNEDVTSLLSWSNLEVGDTSVTGSYTFKGVEKTCTISINEVTAKALSSITLAGAAGASGNNKFTARETFNIENVTITARFNNGSNNPVSHDDVNLKIYLDDVDITAGHTFSDSEASDTVENHTIKIAYTYNGVTRNATYKISVSPYINPIGQIYSKTSGASVDVYGYYVGFLDGTGPVIMDGDYGVVVYNKNADVSSYTANETILHVTGSVSIFNGLYEIGSATISLATGSYTAPETPVVYSTKGGETANYASRLTTVTGTPTVSAGSFDSDAGTADITMNFAVGLNTVQVFYKKAAQTADSEAFAAIKSAVASESEITIKGFTGWFNGFQVQMNGYVPAAVGYTALEFAQDLLDQTDTVCDEYDGVTNNHNAIQAIWSDLASENKYPSLPSDQKTILADAEYEYDQYGNVVAKQGTDTNQKIAEAMARYEYLTGKYELSNFINGRTPVEFANNLPASLIANSGATATIIVVISLVSITALGGFFFLRKRKEER